MQTYLRGGLVLLLAVVVILAGTWFAILRATHPGTTCPSCVLAPQLGPGVYISKSTYHAYHLQKGVFVDMGPVTPVPGVNQ